MGFVDWTTQNRSDKTSRKPILTEDFLLSSLQSLSGTSLRQLEYRRLDFT